MQLLSEHAGVCWAEGPARHAVKYSSIPLHRLLAALGQQVLLLAAQHLPAPAYIPVSCTSMRPMAWWSTLMRLMFCRQQIGGHDLPARAESTCWR